jgi:hypothetical protein
MCLELRAVDCRFPSLEVALWWALATYIFHLQYIYTAYAINCNTALCQETKEADKEQKIMKFFFLSEGLAITQLSF